MKTIANLLHPLATTAATWVLEQLVDLVTDSMEDAQKTWMADTAKEIGTNIINQEYGNYNVVIFLDDIWDDSNYYISTEFADCAHVEWEPLGDFLDIFGSPGSQGYQVCAFKEGEFLVTATEDEDMWTWWGWCDTTEDGGVQCSAP